MKILVANIGSTSFKFRLFDMSDERELARGGVERIGSNDARVTFRGAGGADGNEVRRIADYAAALECSLGLLAAGDSPVLADPGELAAVGFKAVMARGVTGVQRVTKPLLRAMEAYSPIAPAHNPPYIAAMRRLLKQLPNLPLVAAFETGFHQTIPERNRLYACPVEWFERYGICRQGFHGASHSYIARRTAELVGRGDLRIISCHLGGSSSISAIRSGQSLANSFGFSPQSGLPHNNRAGEFDPFALLAVKQETGRSFKKLLRMLADSGGLEGLSGVARDLREIEQAAAAGDTRAKRAIDAFVAAVRHYVGAYLVELHGADVLVFTGGIGENAPAIRSAVCRDLDWCGIRLDETKNQAAKGESLVSQPASRVAVWAMPTNEELMVARQVKEFLACCSRA
jgi:acetate kinase